MRITDNAGNTREASVDIERTGIASLAIDSFDTGNYARPVIWVNDMGDCEIQNSVSHSGSYALWCDADYEDPFDVGMMHVDLGPTEGMGSYQVWARAAENGDVIYSLTNENTQTVLVLGLNALASGQVQIGTVNYPETSFDPSISFTPDQWYLFRVTPNAEDSFDVEVYDSDGTTLLGEVDDIGDSTEVRYAYYYTEAGNGYFDDATYGEWS